MLLRSKAGTGSGVVGKRTFLHPAVPLVAFYDEPVEAFYGAPQSVAVHHFADRGERVGYFLETAPTHPMLSAIAFPGFGDAHRKLMERLPYVQATIALLIDGHPTEGGAVDLADGRIKLHYPLTRAAARGGQGRAWPTWRAELAAGAREVMTLHETPMVSGRRPTSRVSTMRPSGRTATPSSPPTRWAAARWARIPVGRWSTAAAATTSSTTSRRRRLGVPHQPGRQPADVDLRPRAALRDRDREEPAEVANCSSYP